MPQHLVLKVRIKDRTEIFRYSKDGIDYASFYFVGEEIDDNGDFLKGGIKSSFYFLRSGDNIKFVDITHDKYPVGSNVAVQFIMSYKTKVTKRGDVRWENTNYVYQVRELSIDPTPKNRDVIGDDIEEDSPFNT